MTCLDNLKNGNTTYKNKCCMCTKEIDYNGIELLEIENYVEEEQEKEINIVNYDGGFIEDE